LLAFFLCAFNARAALNCQPDGASLDMFAGNYGGFFGFPDEIADLVIGSRVGPMREVNLRYRCTNTTAAPVTTQFGTGMKAASGMTWHAATNTYTNPQLEARGLGYRFWWHEPNGAGVEVPAASHSNPTQDGLPDNWYPTPNQNGTPFILPITTRVIFFKINNNFQNTDGAYVSASITANLFNFYITRPAAPVSVAGSVYSYHLTLNSFSSAKRVCTPFVEAVNFAYINALEMPASGPVEASTRQFALTFNCPYMAYYTVGFRLAPSNHGIADAANGVFGIKQGPGFAQGIGIQVLAENVATGWTANQNHTSPWQVLMPNQDYTIPWFEYSSGSIALDPALAQRTRVVNFRARYYRLPGPVTGGKVEAAVIVHFVYQ